MSLPMLASLRKERQTGNTVYNLLLVSSLLTKILTDLISVIYLLNLVFKTLPQLFSEAITISK